jgi:hypothetical protein
MQTGQRSQLAVKFRRSSHLIVDQEDRLLGFRELLWLKAFDDMLVVSMCFIF